MGTKKIRKRRYELVRDWCISLEDLDFDTNFYKMLIRESNGKERKGEKKQVE